MSDLPATNRDLLREALRVAFENPPATTNAAAIGRRHLRNQFASELVDLEAASGGEIKDGAASALFEAMLRAAEELDLPLHTTAPYNALSHNDRAMRAMVGKSPGLQDRAAALVLVFVEAERVELERCAAARAKYWGGRAERVPRPLTAEQRRKLA